MLLAITTDRQDIPHHSAVLSKYSTSHLRTKTTPYLKNDGWYHDRTKGSHRQYKHPTKPGVITIAGKPNGDVPKGTLNNIREAFGLDDDWEKMKKLKEIYGVAGSVASVILHLYDPKKYPILDVHALRTIGIDNKKVNYDEPFWQEYVNLCRAQADRYDVSTRTLDRALWKYSESGNAERHR